MFDIPNHFFMSYLKSFEFQLRTWNNQRAIRAAYTKHGIGKLLLRFPKKILFIIGVCCLGALLIASAPFLFKTSSALIHLVFKSMHQQMPAQGFSLKALGIGSQAFHRVEPTIETTPLDNQAAMIPQKMLQPAADQLQAGTGELDICLYANKATKTLTVFKAINSKWTIAQTFFIGTGANGGRKMSAGDKKTPLGLYYIVERKDQQSLAKIYGPLAYVLSYPNADDRANKRTGEGIWIHGTTDDTVPFQTKGCIELRNSNLKKLAAIVGNGKGIPIVIVDTTDTSTYLLPPYTTLLAGHNAILATKAASGTEFDSLITQWAQSWMSRDITEYERWYNHDSFNGGGLSWAQWRAKKESTFAAAKSITVSCSKVVISPVSDSLVSVRFIQHYTSTTLQSDNGKQLYFTRTPQGWKIYRESVFPKEELL